MNSLSRALRAARTRSGLGTADLAALLDVAEDELVLWEKGDREPPSRAIVRCARALAITIDELLDGDLERAAIPDLLLRSTEIHAEADVLPLVADLTAFVDASRQIAGLRAARDVLPRPLPAPPTEALAGHAVAPYLADELARWLRSVLGISTPAVPSMKKVFEDLGIPIVWAAREEMSPSIDGAAIISPSPAVLVHLVEGPSCWWRTRMTLAHELCHLLCDLGGSDRPLALASPTATSDPDGVGGVRSRRAFTLTKTFDWTERRASAFASHFLVPDEQLKAALAASNPASESAIATVCQTFGVGRITAVNRISHVYGFSRELRERILRRAHVDRHAGDHPDVAPASSGVRGGVLLDEVALALRAGRIDRSEAHALLDLPLTEALPNHELLSDADRRPLRAVEDDVRALVGIRLVREGHTHLHPQDVSMSDAGWSVEIVDADGQPRDRRVVSFDLDAERTLLSA